MGKHASRLAFLASALVLASGLLFAGVQAQALEPRPPDALLKQGDRTLQKGRPIAYCWTRGCVDYFEDRYPSAVLVEPGAQLRIRLTENKVEAVLTQEQSVPGRFISAGRHHTQARGAGR